MFNLIQDIVALVLMGSGLFFFFVSTLGLLRMPDVYTRLHATSNADTLGAGLSLLGVMIHLGWSLTSLKLLMIIAFIAITSPTSAHVIGKAALRARVRPACGQFVVFDLTEGDDDT